MPVVSSIETSLENFSRDVLDASETHPVLVDFWAEWCAPCLVLAPVLDRVMEELKGQISLAKLEVDEGENMKLAGHYRVRGFPTIILFVERQEVARFSGARSRSQVLEFIAGHVTLTHPSYPAQ
jgi:putative thioredoxin